MKPKKKNRTARIILRATEEERKNVEIAAKKENKTITRLLLDPYKGPG